MLAPSIPSAGPREGGPGGSSPEERSDEDQAAALPWSKWPAEGRPLRRSEATKKRETSAHADQSDDRGAGGRDVGPVARPGPGLRGARTRGPVPLRSLRPDREPAGDGLARRVGHARGARGAHRTDPSRDARVAGNVPPPQRARED